MEIPYVVEPRKDTGLNNSKIAIWLFLASEVMLFGGLFSGYVFLRIYADYPWPERTLPVLPGLINTFVLIGSSVTVVFAWVSLKLRQWRKFQIYMWITIICAALFMVLKGIEYNAKFHHQAIRLDDYTVVEGHSKPQGDDEKDKKAPHKNLNIEASSLTVKMRDVDDKYYDALSDQYEKAGFQLAKKVTLSSGKEIAKGTAISFDIIKQVEKDHLAALAYNSDLNIEIGRRAWAKVKSENPGLKYYEKVGDTTLKDLATAEINKLKEKADYKAVNPILTFVPQSGTASISVNPYWGKLSNPVAGEKGQLLLKDSTSFDGTIADSSIKLLVDGIDFRHTVMKAEEKGIDPKVAINNSWLLKENENMSEIWAKHQLLTRKLIEYLEPKGKKPTENDLYRINWQEIAGLSDKSLADLESMDYHEIMALFPGDIEGFAGADHDKVKYPKIVVPREQVRFESLFTPRWNTYYATYFTITGLHGIHVVAGALVLAYYLFFGRKMYNEKPEWLANRVEVGGLFWHFVDLVWIFLFPILYLM